MPNSGLTAHPGACAHKETRGLLDGGAPVCYPNTRKTEAGELPQV